MKKVFANSNNVINNSAYIINKAFLIQKSILIFCIISSVVTISINLLKLYLVPTILECINAHEPKIFIAIITVFVVLWMLLDSIQTYINANVIFGRIELRSYFTFKIHTKLATTSFPNTEKQDFLNKLDRASTTVSGNDGAISDIWNIYSVILQSVIGLIIYMLLICNVDVWLVGITTVTSIIGYMCRKRADKWLYNNREEEAEYSRKIAYINGIAQKTSIAKDIRVFDMKKWLDCILKNDFTMYEKFLKNKEEQFWFSDMVKMVLTLLRNSIAYIYIIMFMTKNNLPVSYFLLYFNAINGFDIWIDGLLSSISKLNEYSNKIWYIREFLHYKEDFLFEGGKSIKKSDTYRIQLKNVCYTYPNSDKECIHNLNLDISPKEKLAIVGLNGAGKTTLVKLICGLIEPSSGEILLNENNIKMYNRSEYYRLFSSVFQKSSILAGTIACNIAQTSENIDMDKVQDCLKKAGLYEKINSIPNQSATKIGKEVYDDAIELSGGEMQRLLLARALYKDGSILILDEPTAALDPIAEAGIYEKYDEISKDKTAIYISHRLASTKFCDRIILLNEGTIIEEGTHEELMEAKGKYFELFNVQSKYYKDEE